MVKPLCSCGLETTQKKYDIRRCVKTGFFYKTCLQLLRCLNEK